jgi:hypothetical protein
MVGGAPAAVVGTLLLLSNLGGFGDLPEGCRALGVTPSLIMYQNWIDPDDTGAWARPDLTEEWLLANVPPEYSGYLVLDWEAGVMSRIAAGPSDPGFDDTVAEMARLLAYVKDARPEARVGYFDLPFSAYWRQDDTWRAAMAALEPVIDASDALFPCVYDFYPGEARRDRERFGALVEVALDLAGGKPVILYTHHRYHHEETDHGFELIPRDEYVEHIRGLMEIERGGARPAGVVAWGEERYFYSAAFERAGDGSYARTGAMWDRARSAYLSEMAPGESIDEYGPRLYASVCCLLAEAVRGVPCRVR